MSAEKKCDDLPSEDTDVVYVPESQVPPRYSSKLGELIEKLRKISEGNTLVTSEDDLGIRAASLRVALRRLKRRGVLSAKFYATSRTHDGATKIYIVHLETPGTKIKTPEANIGALQCYSRSSRAPFCDACFPGRLLDLKDLRDANLFIRVYRRRTTATEQSVPNNVVYGKISS